ncbi:MAG: hypothetical protein KGY76_09405 [Candidatus Thermoplasmatota archaeon]|nr:hypothetical protein [Candidatus Thermoplasmatota archaeon]
MKNIRRQDDEESGAIGIGTLIVFIGLILVAAIASAVIVGVMGDLQQTAKRTGQETQENVAPPVQVEHAEAEVDAAPSPSETQTLRVYLTAVEGSTGYNLTNLVVMTEGEDGASGEGFSLRYTYDGTGDTVDGAYDILQVTDSTAGNYLYSGEVAALNITSPYPMTPDSDLTIKFMSSEGATSEIFRTVTQSQYPSSGWFELR